MTVGGERRGRGREGYGDRRFARFRLFRFSVFVFLIKFFGVVLVCKSYVINIKRIEKSGRI